MSEGQRSSKKYAKISIKRRNQLIEFVLTQGKGVAQAAKRLNIKLSTAKHIIKTYEETGYLYNKKMFKNQSLQATKDKQSPEEPQIIQPPIMIKEQDHYQVKVETKSQSPEEPIQLTYPPNIDAIYPLSQYACIPLFLFYTNNKN